MRDPLIVIGNGPSLKKVDLTKLTNFDTFGVKAAYKFYEDQHFYPTYYGAFDNDWLDLLETQISLKHFIDTNPPISKYFFFTFYKPIFKTNPKIQYINPITQHQRVIEVNDLLESRMSIHKKVLDKLKQIYPNKSIEDLDGLIMSLYLHQNRTLERLNENGVVKLILNEPLTEQDYQQISTPILKVFPQSFEHFDYAGGSSTLIACQIGILLGYKHIILIGVDCNFKGSVEIDYFDEQYFKPEETPLSPDFAKKINEGQIKCFEILKEFADERQVTITNCNVKSNLECFPKNDLYKELEKF